MYGQPVQEKIEALPFSVTVPPEAEPEQTGPEGPKKGFYGGLDGGTLHYHQNHDSPGQE